MDVNGTRFHILLTERDWRLSPDEKFDWDDRLCAIRLRAKLDRFIAAPRDTKPSLDDRRGAASDRYGNWYWIDAGRKTIRVQSAGSGNASDFWPTGPANPGRHGDFLEQTPSIQISPALSALAVTADHYLVVGTIDPAGLLVFDLFGGGEPLHLRWPKDDGFVPYDMAARPEGGVFVLDRNNRNYWLLDRDLKATVKALPSEVVNPIAIEALPDDSTLFLDRGDGAGFSRIVRLKDLDTPPQIFDTELAFQDPDTHDETKFVLLAHDFAVQDGQLFVVSDQGNQAFAFDLDIQNKRLVLDKKFYPLRLFGGKGIACGNGYVHYDFGERWIPLVSQAQPRYEPEATFCTRIFDGREPDCIWHRLILDCYLPSHTQIRIRSRAADFLDPQGGDENTGLDYVQWRDEPPFYQRRDGSELPWLPAVSCSADEFDGSWELLFQNARGRYLQLEITMLADGRSTPLISALRVWYPRFSYSKKYLPAVYREEAEPALFLERFLANFEGIFSTIEERIAAAQILFDWRTAPPDTLEWLSDWFGLTLDTSWDEARRRCFIRHAMTLFQYRGTVHGIRFALQLALDDCIDERDVQPRRDERSRPFGIRIVEQFRTRQTPETVFGAPLTQTGPRLVSLEGPWTPSDGSGKLSLRYGQFLNGKEASAQEFPLLPPESNENAQAGTEENAQDSQTGESKPDPKVLWAQFAQSELGFIPEAGVSEISHWRQYLENKYQTLQALNLAHGTTYTAFTEIALPADWRDNTVFRTDWQDFLEKLLRCDLYTGVRLGRWQDALQRRYRTIGALNSKYGTQWETFKLIPRPDRLPANDQALADWYAYESTVRPMQDKAHRFMVYLPTRQNEAPDQAIDRLRLASRIVELEKPAHTIFNVQFYWALFRIGEARLGYDTLLGQGSRASELMPALTLGQGYLGSGHVAPAVQPYGDRTLLEC